MPFNFQTPDNPYALTIAQALQQRGAIEGQRATQVGDAQARAATASGQAWGGAAQNIGQAVGNTVQQFASPEAQKSRLEVSELQRQVRSRNIFEAELKNPANYAPDGSINADAVSTRLQKQDVGAWQSWQTLSAGMAKNALDLRQTQAQIAASEATTAEKHASMAQAQEAYLGQLAMNAEDLIKQDPANPQHASDTFLAAVARAAVDGAVSPDIAKRTLEHFNGAPPEALQQALGAFITPGMRDTRATAAATRTKTEAEAAKATAEANAITEQGSLTPGSLEEQYLRAKSKGDEPKATSILQTIKDTANAKRDPAAQALAQSLGALNQQLAQERLDKLKSDNAPVDVTDDVKTTVSGQRYIDIGGYDTPTAKEKARAAARAAGLPVVSAQTASALEAADQAKLNMTAMLNNIIGKLPKDVAARPGAYASKKLADWFQTDEDKAAFASWRSGAIQAAQAMAEKGMGFRLNQAEINLIQSTDQTQLTDTVGTALNRLRNILTMLQNKERVALTRDRSTLAPKDTPGAAALPVAFGQDAAPPAGKTVKVGGFTVTVP